MTEPERADDQSTDRANIESVGVRLRTAREHKGLSIDSVAHQLNLSQHRVLDMENDDYRFSNAETYAKGYLRSYAKLLGLNPEELIHDFDRLQFTETIEHHETQFIPKRQVSSSDRWMRWITYSIGFLLIFLVAIWWRSQPNSPSETAALVSNASEHTPIKIEAREHPQAQGIELGDGFSQELAKDPSTLGEAATVLDDASNAPSNQKKDQATSETSTQEKLPRAEDSSTQKKDQAADNSSAQKTEDNLAKTEDATPKLATDQAVNKATTPAHGAAKVTTKTPAKTPTSDDADEEEEEEEEEGDDDQGDTKKHSHNDVKRKPSHLGLFLKSGQLREAQSLQRQLEKEFKQG